MLHKLKYEQNGPHGIMAQQIYSEIPLLRPPKINPFIH